jgi:predicted dehydrogenase
MTGPDRIRLGFIGLGAMARWHLRSVLEQPDTHVVAVCEPSLAAYAAAHEEFGRHGLTPPPNDPSWQQFVATWSGKLDAVWIVTPHVLHFEQAKACLEAGIDVLLEKPMVMTTEEALALIEARNRTGRELVVTFQGSHSPGLQEARRRLRAVRLYRAADCYLQDGDYGFGRMQPLTYVACVAAVNAPDGTKVQGSWVEEWVPISPSRPR